MSTIPRAAGQKYSVLLIDDSEDDRLFIGMALRRYPSFCVVGEVSDGEDAIAYLSGAGDYGDRQRHPFPDIILLDLKMPRKTGHEVLEWLQTQSFDRLFKAVLSGSFLQEDVAKSMALGADAHYKKDALKEGLDDMLRALEKRLESRALPPAN
jgi:CheY-like chemotaxis protein